MSEIESWRERERERPKAAPVMEDWALSVPMSRIGDREGVNSWESQIGSNHGLGCSKGLDREWLRVFEELKGVFCFYTGSYSRVYINVA